MSDRISDIEHLPARTLARMFDGAQREREMWREFCLEAENTAGQALGLMLRAAREIHGQDGDTELVEQMRKAFPDFFKINPL